MKKVYVITVMALVLFNVSAALAAAPSDVVKLVNQSAHHLSITQKVSVDGEILEGGWEQAPLETYDEQYYSENTRLLFIKIDVRAAESGPIVEEIFSKTIPPHDMQMHFEIVVQPDKTVTYSAQYAGTHLGYRSIPSHALRPHSLQIGHFVGEATSSLAVKRSHATAHSYKYL